MKRLFVVVASVAMLACAAATGALAGEVKGPPGTINNTNETGALNHANSACAADREDTWKGPRSKCVDHFAAGNAMTMTSATHHEKRRRLGGPQ